MRQRRDRVLGPYRDRDGYRIVVIEGGARATRSYPTKAKAEAVKAKLAASFHGPPESTMQEAIDLYLEDCRTVKGLRAVSVAWYAQVLRRELPGEELLADLTPARAAALYLALARRPAKWNGRTEERPCAVASHRAYLRVMRTFCGWAVRQKLLEADPFADVRAEGKARRGKPQLTQDEARRYLATALGLPGEGPLLAALPLITGGRSGEILGARVRDVDAGGSILWLEGKTGRRPGDVSIPVVQEALVRLAAGRGEWDHLWTEGRSGVHLLRWVRRICDTAKVRRVCPHGLRGTICTGVLQQGVAGAAAAAWLGHGVGVMRRDYAAPGAEEAGQQREGLRRLGVIQGGKA